MRRIASRPGSVSPQAALGVAASAFALGLFFGCPPAAAAAPTPAERPAQAQPEAQPEAQPPTRAAPGFSISFAFEPRVGSYRAVDAELRDYGFTPVAKPWLLTYGLRGRVWTQQGWIFGGAMSFGFRAHRRDDNPVPTTLTTVETMLSAGHQLGAGFDMTLDAGFASYSMGVGSTVQGGALVYLGPALAPRVGYVLPTGSSFLRLSLGYSATFPVGDAHSQPLWEDSFRQLPIHAVLIGVESGFAMGIARWRYKGRSRR